MALTVVVCVASCLVAVAADAAGRQRRPLGVKTEGWSDAHKSLRRVSPICGCDN